MPTNFLLAATLVSFSNLPRLVLRVRADGFFGDVPYLRADSFIPGWDA
jgi:hypothetical protein